MSEDKSIEFATVVKTGVTPAEDLAVKRLAEQYMLNRVSTRSLPPFFISDGDRYRWMRANRDSTAIKDALKHAARDADFDAAIDAAIRMSVAGRRYFRNVLDTLS